MSASQKEKCFHCQQKILVSQLDRHERDCASMRPHECHICHRRFESAAGLNRHRGMAHSAEELGSSLRCNYPDCEYGTDNQTLFQAHLERHRHGLRRSRSRSRSRSRAPSNVRHVVPEEPIMRPSAPQPPQGYQETPVLSRRRSRSAVNRSQESMARQGTPAPPSVESTPIVNGMYQLKLVRPEVAYRIMDEQGERLDAIMLDMQRKNAQLRELCRSRGLPLFDDKIQQMIDQYFHTYNPQAAARNAAGGTSSQNNGNGHGSTDEEQLLANGGTSSDTNDENENNDDDDGGGGGGGFGHRTSDNDGIGGGGGRWHGTGMEPELAEERMMGAAAKMPTAVPAFVGRANGRFEDEDEEDDESENDVEMAEI